MSFTWQGDKFKARAREASRFAIDQTMSSAVIEAKNNHPGWKNITSAAEGSVRIIRPARQSGRFTAGEWGSQGVNYVIFLELKHGSFLRNAADVKYRTLRQNLAAAYKRG